MQTTATPVADVRARRFRMMLIATHAIAASSIRRDGEPENAYRLARDYALNSARAGDLTADQRESLLTVAAQAAGL